MDRGQPKNTRRMRRALRVPLLAALLLSLSATAAQAANTIVVNTPADAAPNADECSGDAGATDCSLRQAVDKAASGDTIQLPAGLYGVTLGSDIDISKSLTIEGDTTVRHGDRRLAEHRRQLRRDPPNPPGRRRDRHDRGPHADGRRRRSRRGLPSCNPCLTLNGNGGGAVFDNGSLILDDVAFKNDLAPVGGAVSTSGNSGTLTMTDVSFTGGGGSIGGALFTHGGTVNGDGVTFESNGNGAFDGGAAYLAGGTVTLINTTIVNNGWASSFGGGIDNAGANLTLSNDTFSGNVRGAIETDNGSTTTVANTIIGAGFSDGVDFACVAAGKGNDAGSTTSAAITNDLGNNIDEDGSCNLTKSTDFSDVDATSPRSRTTAVRRARRRCSHGSPAIGDREHDRLPAHRPARHRTVRRRDCDIGAFQAVLLGPPTAVHRRRGEHHRYERGPVGDDQPPRRGRRLPFRLRHLARTTSRRSPDVAAAGVVSSDTAETETLSGLTPDTTYYYLAAARQRNLLHHRGATSSRSRPCPARRSSRTSTSTRSPTRQQRVHFSIDPQGCGHDVLRRVRARPERLRSADAARRCRLGAGAS